MKVAFLSIKHAFRFRLSKASIFHGRPLDRHVQTLSQVQGGFWQSDADIMATRRSPESMGEPITREREGRRSRKSPSPRFEG